MRYLSLFSGIEAASVAWGPLGWECVGFAEIEKFPCKVLAHHYPQVPNLGDVTKIAEFDVMALGPKGEIWIVECKSSRTDYISDRKWQGYLEWADRFFWAVDTEFPIDLLPPETGLIMADGYGAEILRMGPATPLAGARRKVITQKFARHAALRLQGLRDPGVTSVA